MRFRRDGGSNYWIAFLVIAVLASAGCASLPAGEADVSPPAAAPRFAGEVMAGPASTGNADSGY